MKTKVFLANIALVVLFFLFEPLLHYLGELTDTYSLGAEIILGNCLPFLFLYFVFAALWSIGYSIVLCFKNKDIKQLTPIWVVGAFAYVWVSDANSFWVSLIDFYVNARYMV